METRIYLDGNLVSICSSDYALMCNYTQLREKYGDRVYARRVPAVLDNEKISYLNKLHKK